MTRKLAKYYILLVLCLCKFSIIGAQKIEAQLKFSNTKIDLGEDFAIALEVFNSKQGISPLFPQISGFEKGNLSQSSETSIINGVKSSKLQFVQHYKSVTAGKFQLKGAFVTIANQKIEISTLTLTVKKPFGYDDANFLSLTTNKNKCFEGEGVHLELIFWYDISETGAIQFSNNSGQQLQDFKDALKSLPLVIDNMPNQTLRNKKIGSKEFQGVRLLNIIVTPNNSGKIILPNARIGLDKFFKSKGQSKLIEKIYKTSSQELNVQSIPSINNQKLISGSYQVSYNLNKNKCSTGNEIIMTVKVTGEGNLPYLDGPLKLQNDSLLIMEKSQKLNLELESGVIKGEKVFIYSIVPQIPGFYNLSDYFEYQFFDYKQRKETSFSPKGIIEIEGKSLYSDVKKMSSSKDNESNQMFPDVSELNLMAGILTPLKTPKKIILWTNILLCLLIILVLASIGRGFYLKHKKNINE